MKRLRACVAVLFAVAGSAQAAIVADSVAEFSGTQGQGNWYYGYYDGTLSSNTFKLLPHFDGSGIQDNVMLGWSLQLGSGGYWTTVHQLGGHPNGTNGNMGRLPVEQWAVRRWESEVSGPITISGILGPINGGSMLTHIIIDGGELYQQQVQGTNTYSIQANVNMGSTVDFVISPPDHIDVNGDTRFTTVIESSPIPEPSTLIIWSLLASLGIGVGWWRRRKAV